MEFSNSKSSVPEARHRACQICSATRFHFRRLTCQKFRLGIFKDASRWRLTSCSNRIASGDTNGTRCVCIRKRDSASHQPIEIRCVNVAVTERSDRIEPLLVRHDEQDVGPCHWHFVAVRQYWSAGEVVRRFTTVILIPHRREKNL